MYELKNIPEDFIVEEILPKKIELKKEGKYTILLLEKKNYTTEDSIEKISRIYNVERREISYAGIKDKKAVTKQFISIRKQVRNHEEKDIKTTVLGYSNEPISLGDLSGNKFEITIRNLEKNEQVEKTKQFPNYFDKQRFSQNNVEIGKLIVKKNWKHACEILLQEDSKNSEKIKKELENNPKAFINALKKIPKKTLMLYVHAYQSKIWNETLKKYLQQIELQQKIQSKTKSETKIVEEIPIIGFGTELNEEPEEIKKIIENIMKEENITFRDFIVREMPEISFDGTKRKTFMQIKELEIDNKEKDELNKDKYKIKVKFILEKGAYATMAIQYMLQS